MTETPPAAEGETGGGAAQSGIIMTQIVTEQDYRSMLLAGSERGEAPEWAEELRAAGRARFAAAGLPGARAEEWRFTNFSALASGQFVPVHEPGHLSGEELAAFTMAGECAAELVFVDGVYAPELSTAGKLPRGVEIGTLAAAMTAKRDFLQQHLGRYARAEKNPFAALNLAHLRDGTVIHLPAGRVVERPIHVLHVTLARDEPQMTHPRVLVVAESAAEATVVESYAGADGGVYYTNAVTELVAMADARIDYCKLQQASPDSVHTEVMEAQLGPGASLVMHSATLGGKLTRNDLNVVLGGEHAEATVNGLVIIGGEQHVDNHTLLDHAAASCPSHELYKHVLGGQASGVFKGKILVRPGAQKTDSKQTSKSLLLTDEAQMNAMPALEIYADDVKCTHGSTTGPVDDEMVFYLRSRGISLEAARHLLTYAFAADITRRIRVEPVRRRLESFMAAQHGLPQDLRITDLGHHDEASR